jgi:hypothetical protein
MTEIQEHEQEQEQPQTIDVAELHALVQLLGTISIVMGVIVLVIGIGYLIVAYGLLKVREWARTISDTHYNINPSSSIYYNNKHAQCRNASRYEYLVVSFS